MDLADYRAMVKAHKEEINDLRKKHYTKRYKGFLKMLYRQDAKPDINKVVLSPQVLTWSSKKGAYVPVKIKFWNNKWNGMNLKTLTHRENNQTKDIFGVWAPTRTLNNDGKYVLTREGRKLLNKKKAKNTERLNNLKNDFN